MVQTITGQWCLLSAEEPINPKDPLCFTLSKDEISDATLNIYFPQKDEVFQKFKRNSKHMFVASHKYARHVELIICGNITLINFPLAEKLSLCGMPSSYYNHSKFLIIDNLKGILTNHRIHVKELILENMEKFNLRHISCDVFTFINAGKYPYNWMIKKYHTLIFDGGYIQPDAFHPNLKFLVIKNGAQFHDDYKKHLYAHLTTGIDMLLTDNVNIANDLVLYDFDLVIINNTSNV